MAEAPIDTDRGIMEVENNAPFHLEQGVSIKKIHSQGTASPTTGSTSTAEESTSSGEESVDPIPLVRVIKKWKDPRPSRPRLYPSIFKRLAEEEIW